VGEDFRGTQRVKILFVDDEPNTVESVKEALLDEGYTVDMVQDTAQARERYVAQQYDMVILDLMMPRGTSFGGSNGDKDKQTGFLLYVDIRKQPRLWDLPVVILTNYPNDAYKIREESAGHVEQTQREARDLAMEDAKLDILSKDLLPSEIVTRIKQFTAQNQ
jgi:CheY-like chemotaxis protein